MEVCKHKQTGKYFIYIQETGDNEALLITPLAEIKSLNLNQFYEVEEEEDDYWINNHLIEQNQMTRFREYKQNRSEESVENVKYLIEQMTEYEKKQLLEELMK